MTVFGEVNGNCGIFKLARDIKLKQENFKSWLIKPQSSFPLLYVCINKPCMYAEKNKPTSALCNVSGGVYPNNPF
jgi:phage antirepressor YoqD-like protein